MTMTYFDYARLAIEPALLVEIASPQCRVETKDGVVLDSTKAVNDPVFRSVDTIARALEDAGAGSAGGFRSLLLQNMGKQLVVVHTDAREAVKALAKTDKRLAIWAACACAREVLRYVPKGEHRPRVAIKATERWLAGQATIEDVREAREGAWDAWRDAYAAYAYAYAAATAAYAAATAAYAAAAADTAAAAAAAYDADDARKRATEWISARDAELARLVGVVAEALPCMPPEVTL